MNRYVMPDKVDELVKSKDLQYLILLGRRSNGKSSAVKALALRDFIRTGEKFAYIRRYSSIDMKRYRVNSYFQSVPGFNVQEITEGKAELSLQTMIIKERLPEARLAAIIWPCQRWSILNRSISLVLLRSFLRNSAQTRYILMMR